MALVSLGEPLVANESVLRHVGQRRTGGYAPAHRRRALQILEYLLLGLLAKRSLRLLLADLAHAVLRPLGRRRGSKRPFEHVGTRRTERPLETSDSRLWSRNKRSDRQSKRAWKVSLTLHTAVGTGSRSRGWQCWQAPEARTSDGKQEVRSAKIGEIQRTLRSVEAAGEDVKRRATGPGGEAGINKRWRAVAAKQVVMSHRLQLDGNCIGLAGVCLFVWYQHTPAAGVRGSCRRHWQE